MALNIPNTDLPGASFLKGIDTGSSMFTRLMQPVLEREKQKQQAQQFAQRMALSKAAAGRAAQAAEDAHKAALNKLDPTFEARQYEALENYYKNQGMPQKNNPVAQENIAQGQSQDNDPWGASTPEAQAAFDAGKSVPATNQMQMPPENPQQKNVGGIDLELMKQHPMLRAWYKKHYGIDPLASENVALHGPARDAADLERLRKSEGENSPVYQNAKADYDAQIDAKKDLRDLRARTKAGLKPGEKEFFNEQTGEPLGKEIPLTAAERQSEEGNILFNEFYPYVYKGAAPFSGEGSIKRLEQAAAHYKSDPKARKLFDDFLLSDKMLAATTVNEASTLKAGRTNRTYNMLKESLNAQDIPNIVKRLIKEYKLPPSAQLKASMRYQEVLSKARQKARKGTPATQKLFYNPEMQAQHESQNEDGSSNGVNENKSVVVIDPNGKKFETTEENASHLPKGWKRG